MKHRIEHSRWARRLVVLAVVIMIPTTSFEAYALHSRLNPTHYARGGEFLTGKPTSTPTPGAGPMTGPAPTSPAATAAAAPSTAALPSAPAATTTPPSGAVTTTPSGSSTPAPGRSPGRSAPTKRTSAQSSKVAGPSLPQVGTYALSVSGSESASFGPFGLCSGDLPTTAELVVSPAAGETATSYDFDLRLYPGQEGKHDERHVLRYTPEGTYTDYEQATVTCFGVKQSTTLTYSPPQLSIKTPLAVGQTWKNHGGDADRTEDATSTVTGTDAITVGAATYPVFVVHTDVTMTGNESGTRARTWWWSPQLGVPLKLFEKISANSSGGTYSNSYTATVTKLPQA